MNAVLDRADLPLVNDRGRGAEIQRRRLRLGIDSVHAFAAATGKDRAAIARAEKDDPRATENTYLALEAWLEQRENEFSSEREALSQVERPGPSSEGVVTIEMSGVFGIENIVFSGPADKADEVRKLAVKFISDVRPRNETDE